MTVEVLAFGQIAEITGKNSWQESNISSTDELIEVLQKIYPSLHTITYKIAVDKKIIRQNTFLQPNSIVALLPAFSGG